MKFLIFLFSILLVQGTINAKHNNNVLVNTADFEILLLNESGNTTFANNDAVSGSINETLMGNVLDNDTDIEGDIQHVALIDTDGDGIPETAPSNTPLTITQGSATLGTLSLDPTTGQFTWIPSNGWEGEVDIIMQICDNNTVIGMACDNSTLTISNMGTSVPDFNPSITVSPINGISGSVPMRVIIDIKEVLGEMATGDLVVLVPKVNLFTFTYDANATVVGGEPTSNSTWAYSESSSYWIFTRTSLHSASEISSFGMVGTFAPLPGTRGTVNFVVQIFNGSGGDSNSLNNLDYSKISYNLFQN